MSIKVGQVNKSQEDEHVLLTYCGAIDMVFLLIHVPSVLLCSGAADEP